MSLCLNTSRALAKKVPYKQKEINKLSKKKQTHQRIGNKHW